MVWNQGLNSNFFHPSGIHLSSIFLSPQTKKSQTSSHQDCLAKRIVPGWFGGLNLRDSNPSWMRRKIRHFFQQKSDLNQTLSLVSIHFCGVYNENLQGVRFNEHQMLPPKEMFWPADSPQRDPFWGLASSSRNETEGEMRLLASVREPTHRLCSKRVFYILLIVKILGW